MEESSEYNMKKLFNRFTLKHEIEELSEDLLNSVTLKEILTESLEISDGREIIGDFLKNDEWKLA